MDIQNDEQKIWSIHDRFIRNSMQNSAIVIELLKLFVKKKILLQVDLSTLEIFKGDWVDHDFNEDRSDVVYRVKWLNNPDNWLYFLFEHKSSIDKQVKKKLLYYTVDIIRQHESQNKAIKFPVILPEVISIILYHGNNSWNVPNSIKLLFAILEGTDEYVMDFNSIIIDLSLLSDDSFCEGAKSRALLLALKYSRRKEIWEKLPEIIHLLNKGTENTVENVYLIEVLWYLINVIGQEKRADFDKIVKREHKQGEAVMGTIADLMKKEERGKKRKG